MEAATINTRKEQTMNRYEVTIWEKAEHWNFYSTVEAADRDEAWKKAAALVKQMGKGYKLVDVR